MTPRRRRYRNRVVWAPFVKATLAWLMLGAAITLYASQRVAPPTEELTIFGVTSAIVLLDLFSTAKLFGKALVLAAGREKNSSNSVIQASYWGTIKLGSLALLLLLFTRGPKLFGLFSAIHDSGTANEFLKRPGLLTGLATFVVVPIAGGLVWHRQVNRDSH